MTSRSFVLKNQHVRPSFRDEDTPVIAPDWVIRNDIDYLVLYQLSQSDSRLFLLPPLMAAFVSLVDGSKTFAQLVNEVCQVFSCPSRNDAQKLVHRFTGVLNAERTVITTAQAVGITNSLRTANLFIPLDRYQIPKNSRLRLPVNVRLVTTNTCQADCIYCYAERSAPLHRLPLTLDAWLGLIDYCIDNTILNIEVSGGDPMCDKVSFEVIVNLLRRGLPVFISTKAALSRDQLSNLLAAGLGRKPRGLVNVLQVSIDSTDDAVADHLTGCRDYVSRTDKNIDECVKAGVFPKIKTVLTPLNYQEIEPILGKYSKRGITSFQFVYYGLSYASPRNDLLLSPQQKEFIHRVAEDTIPNSFAHLDVTIQDEQDAPTALSSEERLSAWAKRSRCSGGYSSLTILPDGDILLCEQLPRQPRFVVGNIQDNTLPEIWNGERLEQFLFPPRDQFRGTPCFDCPEFLGCVHNAGWCYRDTLFAYDTIFEACPRCPRQPRPGRRLV